MRNYIAGRLRAAVARGLQGNATVAVMRGPGGVGKERIIRNCLDNQSLPLTESQIFCMSADYCIQPDGRYDTTALLEQLPRRFNGFELLVGVAADRADEIRKAPGDPALLGRFVDLLIATAQKQPFVWVLTALERADATVAQLLSLLLDRLIETPASISVILAFSDTEPVASRMTSYFIRNVQARVWPNCEQLTLARLDRKSTRL